MDQRAQDLLAAGRAILPRLEQLLGKDGKSVARELTAVIESATESSEAEEVRDILFEYPATRSYHLGGQIG